MNPHFNQLLIKYSKSPMDKLMGKIQEADLSQFLCYYWAYVFVGLYGGKFCSLKIKSDQDTVENFKHISEHAFVKLNDKYYDSRNLNGVILWAEIFKESENFKLADYNIIELDDKDQFLELWLITSEKKNYDRTINQIKNSQLK